MYIGLKSINRKSGGNVASKLKWTIAILAFSILGMIDIASATDYSYDFENNSLVGWTQIINTEDYYTSWRINDTVPIAGLYSAENYDHSVDSAKRRGAAYVTGLNVTNNKTIYFSFNITTDTGYVYEEAGLIFNVQSNLNYYKVRFSPNQATNNVDFWQKTASGIFTQIGSAFTYNTDPLVVNTFKIVQSGSNITVYNNTDTQIANWTNTTYTNGSVGFEGYSNQAAFKINFDTLTISETSDGAVNGTIPLISNVENGTVTSTTAIINFTVNQSNALTHINYSTNSDLSGEVQTINESSGENRSETITDLIQNTTYYYTVWAYNSSNTSLSSNSSIQNFTTSPTSGTTPPSSQCTDGSSGVATYAAGTITLASGENTLCSIWYDVNNSSIISYTASNNTYILNAIIATSGGDITIQDTNLQINSSTDDQYYIESYLDLNLINTTISSVNNKQFYILGDVQGYDTPFTYNFTDVLIDYGRIQIKPDATGSTVSVSPNPVINNLTIQNNHGARAPLDIGVSVGRAAQNLTGRDISILNSSSTWLYGAGIKMMGDNIDIDGVTFNNLEFESGYGGGLVYENNTNVSIKNVTSNNVSGWHIGGKEWMYAPAFTVKYQNITLNGSLSSDGFYLYQSDTLGKLRVEDLVISNLSSGFIDIAGNYQQNVQIFNMTMSTLTNGFNFGSTNASVTNSNFINVDTILLYTLEGNADLALYELVDIYVTDSVGNPISGANVTFTENVTTDSTNDVFNIVDKWFNNSSLTTTSTDGHTPISSNETGMRAVLRYRNIEGTETYYNYTISVCATGYTCNNTTIITPNSTWYRSNPNTYQNTTTIILEASAPTYSVSGYVNDSVGAFINSVSVVNGSNSTTTNVSGYYSISMGNGTYNFTFSKSGYTTNYTEITINGSAVSNQNVTLNITTPLQITNLTETHGSTWINWTWIDSISIDFNKVLVYLEGVLIAVIDAGVQYFNYTTATPATEYNFSFTVNDTFGNINTTAWENHSVTTYSTPIITYRSPLSLTPTVDVNNLITFNTGADQIVDWTWTNVTEGAGDGTTNSTATQTWNTTGAKIVTVTCSNANGSCGTTQWDVTVVSDGSGGGTDYDWATGYVKYPNGTAIPDVTVQVNTTPTQSTTTNALGQYTFDYIFVHGDTYWFNFSKTNHNNSNQSIEFLVGDSQTVNTTLDRNYTANITSWSNTNTSDNSLAIAFSLNVSDSETNNMTFNITANQTITGCTWTGSTQINCSDTTSYAYTNFSTAGVHTVIASVSNANGTSSPITWTITITDSSPVAPASPTTDWDSDTTAVDTFESVGKLLLVVIIVAVLAIMLFGLMRVQQGDTFDPFILVIAAVVIIVVLIVYQLISLLGSTIAQV